MKITKETLYRALRTFIQSAIAFIAVNGLYVNFTGQTLEEKQAIIGLLVSAVASGISAVMNLEREEE